MTCVTCINFQGNKFVATIWILFNVLGPLRLGTRQWSFVFCKGVALGRVTLGVWVAILSIVVFFLHANCLGELYGCMQIPIIKVNACKSYGSIPLGVGIDIVRALVLCRLGCSKGFSLIIHRHSPNLVGCKFFKVYQNIVTMSPFLVFFTM